MKPHTTHFDDCGCQSGRLESELKQLREREAKLELQLRAGEFVMSEMSELLNNPARMEQPYHRAIGFITGFFNELRQVYLNGSYEALSTTAEKGGEL